MPGCYDRLDPADICRRGKKNALPTDYGGGRMVTVGTMSTGGRSIRLNGDPARLGFFNLGQGEPQHAVGQFGIDFGLIDHL